MAILVIVLVGCGHDPGPRVPPTAASSTDAAGNQVLVSDNADQLIQLHVGEHVDVRFGVGGGTNPGFGAPTSSNPSVLRLLRSSPAGGVWEATFEAIAAGTADVVMDAPPRAKCLPNCAVPEYSNAVWHIRVVR
jgi:hypothetical protein